MDKRKDIIKYRFADPQKAYDICCELLEQGMQSGNDYEVAYAYLYMGDTLFSMGKCEEALRYTALAETIQKQNGFDNLLMRTCNIIGIIYMNTGDALLAMDYYHAAMNLAKTYRNYTLLAMVYGNIGLLLTDIGDFEEAAGYYKLSHEYSQKEEAADSDLSFSKVLLCINICDGYLKEKQYDKAKMFLDETLLTIKEDDISVVERMRIAHKYAQIYYHLQDYEKAFAMCEKAILFCGVNRQDVEVLEDYIDIAAIMADTGYVEPAEKLLCNLEESAGQTFIIKQKLNVCSIRIRICEKTGETDKQKEQLKKYYSIRKQRNAERNQIIVSAINNRCRLEEERRQNRFLNEGNRKLIKESEIDELTGIYNRFAFQRRYEKLYKYACKNHYNYCVGIFDVDHFKTYNDSYGHLKGDECLKRIAQILRKTSDGSFCVARYGGDEFVFMAYDVDEEKVRDFSGRLVDNIQKENIPFAEQKGGAHVTISVGAILQDTVENAELAALLKKADKVLYEVKQTGKNGYKIDNFTQSGCN